MSQRFSTVASVPSTVAEVLASVLRGLGSDQSRRAYKDDWGKFYLWLGCQGVEVEATKPKHIAAHLDYLFNKGLQHPSVARALSIVREVFRALVRYELIENNPAREVKMPRAAHTPNTPWLTEDQIKLLLSIEGETWTEKRNHLCVCLLFGLGWRRAEVARMCVEDFRGTTVTGKIKGGKTLTVGVPTWLTEKIIDWCVFAGITEGPLLPRTEKDPRAINADIVYYAVKLKARAARLSEEVVTPHALRRTNITLGGARGVSLKERQLAVGHSSQATTERYDRARDATVNAPGQVFADLVGGKK